MNREHAELILAVQRWRRAEKDHAVAVLGSTDEDKKNCKLKEKEALRRLRITADKCFSDEKFKYPTSKPPTCEEITDI